MNDVNLLMCDICVYIARCFEIANRVIERKGELKIVIGCVDVDICTRKFDVLLKLLLNSGVLGTLCSIAVVESANLYGRTRVSMSSQRCCWTLKLGKVTLCRLASGGRRFEGSFLRNVGHHWSRARRLCLHNV